VIRRCDEHGYFADCGRECPDCGAEGDAVLNEERRVRLSKFVSGALRHFPDDTGIELNERGWANYDGVVGAVTSRYGWAHPEHVEASRRTRRGVSNPITDRIESAPRTVTPSKSHLTTATAPTTKAASPKLSTTGRRSATSSR